MKKTGGKAFTLVELLVSMALMGVLFDLAVTLLIPLMRHAQGSLQNDLAWGVADQILAPLSRDISSTTPEGFSYAPTADGWIMGVVAQGDPTPAGNATWSTALVLYRWSAGSQSVSTVSVANVSALKGTAPLRFDAPTLQGYWAGAPSRALAGPVTNLTLTPLQDASQPLNNQSFLIKMTVNQNQDNGMVKPTQTEGTITLRPSF